MQMFYFWFYYIFRTENLRLAFSNHGLIPLLLMNFKIKELSQIFVYLSCNPKMYFIYSSVSEQLV